MHACTGKLPAALLPRQTPHAMPFLPIQSLLLRKPSPARLHRNRNQLNLRTTARDPGFLKEKFPKELREAVPPVASCRFESIDQLRHSLRIQRQVFMQRSEHTQPPFKHPVSPSIPLQSRRVEEEAIRGTEPGVKDEFVDADEVPR